jgi:ABC-type sugar transport system ATPase subunit
MPEPQPLLAARQVTKSFPGVTALKGVSVEFAAGEVHALVGENGAGKSTLGKVLAGLYPPDSGDVRRHTAAGVVLVHQELLFAENLSVADNLSLGSLAHRGPWIDEDANRRRAVAALAPIAPDISPDTVVGRLPISKQQLVQIAGGVASGAQVLIFDEPTSSLTEVESERLRALIRELARGGGACIYVSHRLEEVLAIADRVTVLRDGELVWTRAMADVTPEAMVRAMVGHEPADRSVTSPTTLGDVVLELRGYSSPGKFTEVSLQVRAGEIVGLAGLVGAGRTELLEAIYGLDPRARGEIRRPSSMGLVPEDRKRHGLILGMSAQGNVALPILGRLAGKLGGIDSRIEWAAVKPFFERMHVRAAHPGVEAGTLSGGNQQKLVIARWLAAQVPLLLIDEPTRGVDVGAKAEIHGLLREVAAQGTGLLVASSELPELRALASRILVLHEGRVVAEVPPDATNETMMRAMAGLAA